MCRHLSVTMWVCLCYMWEYACYCVGKSKLRVGICSYYLGMSVLCVEASAFYYVGMSLLFTLWVCLFYLWETACYYVDINVSVLCVGICLLLCKYVCVMCGNLPVTK